MGKRPSTSDEENNTFSEEQIRDMVIGSLERLVKRLRAGGEKVTHCVMEMDHEPEYEGMEVARYVATGTRLLVTTKFVWGHKLMTREEYGQPNEDEQQ